MKALNAALAYARKDRTKSVKALLDALMPRQKQRGTVLKAMLGVCFLVLLIPALPVVMGWLKGFQDDSRQQVARLKHDVADLQRDVQQRSREAADAIAAAEHDLEGVKHQMDAAGVAGKRDLQPTWAVRNRLNDAEFVGTGLRVALSGAKGLAVGESHVRDAAMAEQAEQWQQAGELLQQAASLYAKLKAVPEHLQVKLDNQRKQAIAKINGQWALNDCREAATWQVNEASISIAWPNIGAVEERVIYVGKEGVVAAVNSPERYKGRLYRYQVSGEYLIVSELNHNERRETLKHC